MPTRFLIVLILLSNFAYAQQADTSLFWRFKVADSISHKGIVGASIAIGHKEYFTTDETGSVAIEKRLINSNDSVKISSLGYLTKFLLPRQIVKYRRNIYLSGSITALNEVHILSSNNPKIELGELKKSYNEHWKPLINDEYAQYIPNIKKIKGTIVSVELIINNELDGIKGPFCLSLNSREKDSIYPSESLIKDSIIVRNPERKTHLTVDISKYNVEVPENGFFIVFETLSASHYSPKPIRYRDLILRRVPGLDFFNDNENIAINDLNRTVTEDEPYCMTRVQKVQWTMLRAGICFALNATVIPN